MKPLVFCLSKSVGDITCVNVLRLTDGMPLLALNNYLSSVIIIVLCEKVPLSEYIRRFHIIDVFCFI